MKKKILLIIFALGIFSLLALLAFFKFSSSPQFCRSCHIMETYYKSWKSSKHNKVACVECHYPPSTPKTLLWRKFQALSQVVKYVTRTYSSKPFAEIEDAACLRGGCHAKRLLEGKLTFGKGIKFDHRPHLLEPRRGRQLRCVSCHSQVVVGKHVEVTLDTCYLCHFKGLKEGRNLEPLGGCLSCHELPEKEFKIGNIKYRHKDFVTKHGVECKSCHLDITQGAGDALKDRCFSCHNQPEKLEKYTDIPFIHENHVTKHNIACFHCHTEMTHSVNPVRESFATELAFSSGVKALPKPDKLNCAICHSDMHTGQNDLYAGRGGRGVTQMPSPMFLADVDCLGCHIVEDQKSEFEQKLTGRTFKASSLACVKCHGQNYGSLVDDWKKELDAALGALEPRLTEAQNILEKAPKDSAVFSSLKSLYDEARYNYDFVRLSTGIHNIYYSAKLLENVNESLNKFAKEAQQELPKPQESMLLDGSFCAKLCHAKLGVKIPEQVKYKDKVMPHSVHVEMASPCKNCHEIAGHKELSLKQDLSICKSCHESGI